MWEKIIERAIPYLWPPSLQASAEDQYAWRKNVAFYLYGQVFAMMVLVLWLLGFAPAFVPTPAWSGDIASLRGDLGNIQRSQQSDSHGIRLAQVRRDLKDAVTKYCLAIMMKNQIAIDYAWADLQTLKGDYFKLEAQAWDQPPCGAVIVSN